jgi:hypothetical protein
LFAQLLMVEGDSLGRSGYVDEYNRDASTQVM